MEYSYVSGIDGNPTLSLTDAVESAYQDYTSDFTHYWGLEAKEPPEGLSHDDWRELIKLYGLARKLVQGASSMVRPVRVRDDELSLRELLSEEDKKEQAAIDAFLARLKGKMPDEDWWKLRWRLDPVEPSDPRLKRRFFDNCIEIEASERFFQYPYEIADRTMTLLAYMVRSPGEFTTQYLGRVAECYIRKMNTEFAVMARAALDRAIQDRITDEEVAECVGLRPDGRVDLERRIEACASRSWFDSDSRLAATRIKDSGVHAAHFAPGLAANMDEVLQDLAEVLRALEITAT